MNKIESHIMANAAEKQYMMRIIDEKELLETYSEAIDQENADLNLDFLAQAENEDRLKKMSKEERDILRRIRNMAKPIEEGEDGEEIDTWI